MKTKPREWIIIETDFCDETKIIKAQNPPNTITWQRIRDACINVYKKRKINPVEFHVIEKSAYDEAMAWEDTACANANKAQDFKAQIKSSGQFNLKLVDEVNDLKAQRGRLQDKLNLAVEFIKWLEKCHIHTLCSRCNFKGFWDRFNDSEVHSHTTEEK